jgi:hypothetical protein
MTKRELAKQFRLAADSIERRNSEIAVQDAKDWLLAALNDCDRTLDYGRPGAGLDRLLGKEAA